MKLIGKLYLVLVLCVSGYFGDLSAQPAKKALSLNDCVRIALTNNAAIQTNQNIARISENNYLASLSNILPTVSANYSASRFRSGDATTQADVPVLDRNGQVIGFINQEVTNPGFSRNFYRASLDVNQNVFDGGAWWNRIRRSKAEQKASVEDLDVQVNSVIRTVANNYLNLLKQQKLLEVNTLAVQRSQENLERSQKMFEIGSVAKVDVFRARVNLGNDRIAEISQRNAVKQARQTLNISLGYNPNQPIEIEKDVKFEHKLPPLDDIIRESFKNQPELRRREMDIRAKELSVAVSKSAFLPTISAFFSYQRSNSQLDKIYNDIDKNWNVTIGLQGSYNLFNGFNDRVNYQNSKIDLKNTRIGLEDYKRNLMAAITDTYQNYKDLLEIIEINEMNLEAAREEYRLARERYRLGSGTSLDLREAQVNLTDAERIVVAAQYDLIISYAQLQELVGSIRDKLNF